MRTRLRGTIAVLDLNSTDTIQRQVRASLENFRGDGAVCLRYWSHINDRWNAQERHVHIPVRNLDELIEALTKARAMFQEENDARLQERIDRRAGEVGVNGDD